MSRAVRSRLEPPRHDRIGVGRTAWGRALAGDKPGGSRLRRPAPPQQDPACGRCLFTRSAGPGGSEFRGIGHSREHGWMADGEHASDHDQRRVVAEAGCRGVGVLGPVGARERKPVSRKLLGSSDAELGSWRSGWRPCRAENPHGTSRGLSPIQPDMPARHDHQPWSVHGRRRQARKRSHNDAL